MVKHLPTTQETQVRSLGQEDPLEKEMATHFSILAWKIPWMEEPGSLQSMGSQRTGHDWATSLASWKKSYDRPRQHIKKQRHYFADQDLFSQSYDFSSSHVWMWELDHKQSWAPKNWCFWTVVPRKTLESPWTARRSNQSILKEIRPEYSLEGLMLKLKFQYFGHLMQRT